MDTSPQTPERLAASVFAVPPMARNSELQVCPTQNQKIVSHLEAGGVNLLLYGGNAVFYHIRMQEYAQTLAMLTDIAGPQTGVVPSIGPAFGTMMDQVEVLKDFDFPTVMVLPSRDVADPEGIATGIRKAAEALGKPVVVYLKFDRWLAPQTVASLLDDGLVSWIKYAVVRDDPSEDEYLQELLDTVPGDRVVSGIGEQPAIIHMRDFGVGSFTSGCVCVAPKKSMAMLRAIQAKDYDTAESIRQEFEGLEDQRNSIHPIRVLHRALDLAGIAETGPMLPLLSELTPEQEQILQPIAKSLLDLDASA